MTSGLVVDTIHTLKELSVFHTVRLPWVPGHSNMPGNETADILAKAAAILTFEGPEPVLGIPTGIRTSVQPLELESTLI